MYSMAFSSFVDHGYLAHFHGGQGIVVALGGDAGAAASIYSNFCIGIKHAQSQSIRYYTNIGAEADKLNFITGHFNCYVTVVLAIDIYRNFFGNHFTAFCVCYVY